MTQFIKPQNGGGKGGGTGDMLKSVYDPNNIAANAFDYDNFINTPTIPAAQIQADWNEADNTKLDYIKNKPTIPAAQIQSDWDEADNTKVDYIKNKPNLSGYQTTANLVTDLDNADNTHYPSSLAVKNAITSSGGGDVTGPNSSTDGHLAVFDGITGKIIKDGGAVPTVPTNVSDFNNDAGYITGVDWGDIGGTLSDQTDLNNALANKANSADLGTAAACNTGTSSGNVPILDSNGKLNTSTLPGVALTDTFTVSTASDLTGLSSAEQGDIAIVTTESKTYVLSADPYSTAANWKELLSPTDSVTSVNSKTGAVTLDADDISDSTTTNKFVTATDITTWNGKQNALATQTAYTSKGTSTKVATITTNTLGQVTGITETSIDFPVTSVNGSTGAVSLSIPTKTSDLNNDSGFLTSSTGVTSVNGSTGAVTVSEFNPGGTATTGYVLKKTADGYGWDAESGAVTSVNGQTGAVTVSEFTPTSTGTTDQVLTKTAGGYDWATPSSSTTTTATLTSAGWSSKEQTVSVTGVTASNTIIVSPAPANINDYASCSIYCSAQGSGTLTFKCNTVPSDAITVNVLILS